MERVLARSDVVGLAGLRWQGEAAQAAFSPDGMRAALLQLDQPVWAVRQDGKIGLAAGGGPAAGGAGPEVLGFAPPVRPEALGDPSFCQTYGTRFAYMAGAMANGISSDAFVIALGRAGSLGSYGAGGVPESRIEAAIRNIQAALPDGPYALNLLNSPNEPALEQKLVALFLRHNIRVVEASAYLAMTAGLVWYRAAGLSPAADGGVVIGNRVIGKISRLEMAGRFLEPAPPDILDQLVREGKITPQQAELAQRVPMADDLTVEADSGGHTDNRPLVVMLPAFMALRDQVQAKRQYAERVRVGAGGGIGTPEAALAAFTLGAAYVVTGSINQACVEAATSPHVKDLLAHMDMADVAMAPAGDMFEMGARVQVLKRGSMFAMRAQKLYELYSRYNAWEEVPAAEREKLEKSVFKRDFQSIWVDTVAFFTERDPRQVERGNANPRDKMALVFRWYLGLSSRWAIAGEQGREMDYQVWTGPAMGAFNLWVKGSHLEAPQDRQAVEVARQILTGCAVLERVRTLEGQGLALPPDLRRYLPVSLPDIA